MSGTGSGVAAAQGRVREVIDRLLRERTVAAQTDGTVHQIFPVAAGPAEGVALRDWVAREGATRTIEIGLGYGFSALHIGEGLLSNPDPDRRHTVIDPFQATRFAGCGLQLLAEAGLADMVDHLAQRSEIALPRLLEAGRSFDLAFIDGNHRFDGVFLDLIYLGRLVRAGGIIVLDDYQLPAIRRAVAFCLTNLGWALEEVGSADERRRWAAIRTAATPDTRQYDYFIEF